MERSLRISAEADTAQRALSGMIAFEVIAQVERSCIHAAGSDLPPSAKHA